MDTIGPLVFLNFAGTGGRPGGGDSNATTTSAAASPPPVSLREWMGPLEREMATAGGIGEGLTFVARRVYTLECNWKVCERAPTPRRAALWRSAVVLCRAFGVAVPGRRGAAASNRKRQQQQQQ